MLAHYAIAGDMHVTLCTSKTFCLHTVQLLVTVQESSFKSNVGDVTLNW